jgi:16S rRNA G966 N2-methylase RsmD
MLERRSLVIIVLLLAGVLTVVGQELGKLPYVPTPQVVVDEMLKLAKLTAGDFVIDLGSGDGRIIITAAKNYGADGLGVDIDKKLVELSNRNAKEAGVSERVQFLEGDMFKTDLSRATVVTLYVLPEFMEKLRPKLLTDLRVVAHDYYLPQWRPDGMIMLDVPEKVAVNGTEKTYLYLWIVPAMIKGRWRLFFETAAITQEINLLFDQEYQIVSGTGQQAGKPILIEDPTLRGNEIRFALTLAERQYHLTGRVKGDKIEGKAIAGKETLEWRAHRVP